MYSKLTIQLFYNSNFPILTNLHKTPHYPRLFLKSSDKILCKNFLIFYLFLKIFSLQNQHPQLLLSKPRIHSTKTTHNICNVLRAPYKNKLARNQLTTPIFKFSLQINHQIAQSVVLYNPTQYFYLMRFIVPIFSSFESNVINLNKVRISMCFNVQNYWNYKFAN